MSRQFAGQEGRLAPARAPTARLLGIPRLLVPTEGPLSLERGQATLPNLQITARPF
jgi:hypothetical protein